MLTLSFLPSNTHLHWCLLSNPELMIILSPYWHESFLHQPTVLPTSKLKMISLLKTSYILYWYHFHVTSIHQFTTVFARRKPFSENLWEFTISYLISFPPSLFSISYPQQIPPKHFFFICLLQILLAFCQYSMHKKFIYQASCLLQILVAFYTRESSPLWIYLL